MFSSGLWGCMFQVFGPVFSLIMLWYPTNPALVVVSVGAMLFSLLSAFVQSVVFAIAGENESASADAAYVCIGVLVQELFRLWYCVLVCKADMVFRVKGQVLHNSRFRNVLVGAAIGVGFTVMQSLVTVTVFLDAHNGISTQGSTWYDIEVCPQLPMMYYQSLLHCLLFFAQVSWSAIMIQGVAGSPLKRDGFLRAREGKYEDSSSSDDEASTEVALNHPIGPHHDNLHHRNANSDEEMHRVSSPPQQPQRPPSATTRVPQASPTASTTATTPEIVNPPPAALPTSLSIGEGIACLIIPVILHLVFSTVSLVTNGGAWDYDAGLSRTRGCVVALPVCGMITFVSMVCAMCLAKVEAMPKN